MDEPNAMTPAEQLAAVVAEMRKAYRNCMHSRDAGLVIEAEKADYWADELAPILAELQRAQGGAKPFMYGIQQPDGKPYFEEDCVSSDAEVLEDEVLPSLNDDVDEGQPQYKVVPLFLQRAQGEHDKCTCTIEQANEQDCSVHSIGARGELIAARDRQWVDELGKHGIPSVAAYPGDVAVIIEDRAQGRLTEEQIRELAWKCQVAVNQDAVSRVAYGLGKESFISLHIERVLRAALLSAPTPAEPLKSCHCNDVYWHGLPCPEHGSQTSAQQPLPRQEKPRYKKQYEILADAVEKIEVVMRDTKMDGEALEHEKEKHENRS